MKLKSLTKSILIFLIFAPILLVAVSYFSRTPKKQKIPKEQKEKRPETYTLLKEKEKPSETYTLLEEKEGNLVKNFPNTPQYPVAEVVNSRYYTEENGVGFSADYLTDDTVLDIFNWYRDQLLKGGWEIMYQPEVTSEFESFLIEAVHEDIILTVSAVILENGKTRIVLTHHQGMGEFYEE